MTTKELATLLITAFQRGKHLYLCGNGGSYDLARHMEEEFLCKFQYSRRALPALALKLHSSIANDFGYELVFSRQIEAYGKPNDVLIAFSTSGNSVNVNKALDAARKLGMLVIDFPRKGATTAKIQEQQLRDMHDVCRLVEEAYI